ASYKESLKKWKNNEVRSSKRDLPENKEKYRIFDIPRAFALDAQNYSAINAAKSINKPLMIFIGLDDKVVLPATTEQLVHATTDSYIVRKEGIGHDFRKSEKDIFLVMEEIEKFLLGIK